MSIFKDLFYNPSFVAGMLGWFVASLLKLPTEYLTTKKLNWKVFFSTGGMPSSHSALMVATTLTIGLFEGFNTALFALAVAITTIVLYDAAGVRRQAGIHAQRLNLILTEIFHGEPISNEHLKEVLGHSPLEVAAGSLLGIFIAVVLRLAW